MVKRCYEETLSIVEDNRQAMDKLVEILIEKETIDGEEFCKILAEFTSIPKKERTISILTN